MGTNELPGAVTSTDPRFVVPDSAWGPKDDAGVRYAIASIATLESIFTHWAMPVEVTIRDRAGSLDVVGIDRIDRSAIHTSNANELVMYAASRPQAKLMKAIETIGTRVAPLVRDA